MENMNIEAFIQQHGGYTEFAKKLSLGPYGRQTVHRWMRRNKVPSDRILQMLLMGLINFDEARRLYESATDSKGLD